MCAINDQVGAASLLALWAGHGSSYFLTSLIIFFTLYLMKFGNSGSVTFVDHCFRGTSWNILKNVCRFIVVHVLPEARIICAVIKTVVNDKYGIQRKGAIQML